MRKTRKTSISLRRDEVVSLYAFHSDWIALLVAGTASDGAETVVLFAVPVDFGGAMADYVNGGSRRVRTDRIRNGRSATTNRVCSGSARNLDSVGKRSTFLPQILCCCCSCSLVTPQHASDRVAARCRLSTAHSPILARAFARRTSEEPTQPYRAAVQG
jgi:hypothetical protein